MTNKKTRLRVPHARIIQSHHIEDTEWYKFQNIMHVGLLKDTEHFYVHIGEDPLDMH
jgi:hypothetical protein